MGHSRIVQLMVTPAALSLNFGSVGEAMTAIQGLSLGDADAALEQEWNEASTAIAEELAFLDGSIPMPDGIPEDGRSDRQAFSSRDIRRGAAVYGA